MQRLHRFTAGLTVVLPLAAAPATAQPAPEPLRTAWGAPDLGGIWDFRTLTPLERPEQFGDRAFLTAEEAAELESGAVARNEAADLAPAERTEAGGNIGAYNNFWMDYGTRVVADRRTSLIVDPPNGRRPPLTTGGRNRRVTAGSFGTAPLEEIEDLSLFDRCLGTAGLPIYPEILEYAYTVEDATVWTRPWTAVQTLRRTEGPVFENACHEGNYAATNMLAGARQEEAEAAAGR